jgi:hypothetical protein
MPAARGSRWRLKISGGRPTVSAGGSGVAAISRLHAAKQSNFQPALWFLRVGERLDLWGLAVLRARHRNISPTLADIIRQDCRNTAPTLSDICHLAGSQQGPYLSRHPSGNASFASRNKDSYHPNTALDLVFGLWAYAVSHERLPGTSAGRRTPHWRARS